MTTRTDNTMAAAGGELQAAYAAAAGELSQALAEAGVEEGLGKLQDLLLECAESAKAFQAGMARIYTLLPGLSREACDQLQEDMLEFSGEMGVLTRDAIPAMYSALAAGVDGETIFDFLETAQQAAVVGSLDLCEAVEGLTSIVNAYGETSLDVREAADMLFTAVRLGQTDFQELMDCMGQIGPAAADAGAEFQDVAAALAALAARGVPASKAAAQLDGLLEDLSNSSSQAAQAFKNITGQTFSQFIESGGNVQKALQKLKEHADLTGVGINELFSSVESGKAALELTGPAADSFSSAMEQMNRSAGSMDIAYYGMSHTAEQASQQLQTSVDNMKTAIGSALLPAFERLAHGAAAGLSWAADFVEEHPWVVAAVGAVTAALTVLTTGITVFTVAVKMARAAMDAFKAAAGPIGLVAIAITSVLAALTAYSLMTDDAANRTRELTDSLEESRKAYEEKKEAIAENNDNLLGMANALADLAEKENLSAVEKQIMLSLIDELNERVPELALAYDEASGSLNRTSDAIRDLALAEAERTNNEAAMERLKELYVESAFIDYELARATEELADAQADCADQTERSSAAAGVGMVGATRELTSGLREEHRAVRELTERQKENQEQIQALEAETNEYSQAMRQARDAGREQGDQTSALKRTGQGLLETTQRLIAEEDALSKAYEEQKKTGELSLKTVLSLIEAAESRFLVIDSETGAVKLNTSAYIQARTAKIDDQIASLESHRLSIENKIALGEEALSALGVAEGYIAAAMAKSTLTEEKLKVEAQIQQLEKLKASIKSYSTTTTRAASAVRRASKTVKTQAEKDLEEFKRLKAALDHEKAMGERSEEGYFRKLKGYRDQYLTSKENLDTYRSITESIYKCEQDLMKEQLATYEDHLENMAESAADALDEIKRSYEEVLEKQKDMREKLSEYGALFTEEKDQPLVINDLKEQIQVLKDYEETLSLLRDQGIAQGLLNEILSMDVDSAIGYGRQLLEMDEESWVEYNEDWEQKQALAREISERFFNDELETLRAEYDGKLKEALDSLKDTSYLSGLLTGSGFLDGLSAKEEEIYLKAKKIAEKVAATLSSAYGDTNGNRPKDGSHAAGLAYVPFDGYLAELHRGERVLNSSEASAYIAASKPSPFTLPSEERHFQRQTEAMVNAVGALTAGMNSRENGGDMTVVLQVNGTEFARATLEDFRHASDQSPRMRSDFV